MKVPRYYKKRYEKIIGCPLEVYFPKKAIRVNTLKSSNAFIENFLIEKKISFEKIPYLKNGYFIDDSAFNLVSTKEYLQGLFFIQDASSQLCCEILNPTENTFVLDMCASPGGKSTHLSQIMNNTGTLVCLEQNYLRIPKLKYNLERIGSTNSIVYQIDATQFKSDIKFDFILIDAPCSGNFTQGENWSAIKENSISVSTKNQEIQKKLISNGYALLKDNGYLLYSTCSLEPEEDEDVVNWACKKFNLEIQELDINIANAGLTEFEGRKYDDSLERTKRFIPQISKTQGFFVALLKKTN